MDARLFTLTQIHEACRQMRLEDGYTVPTWSDGQSIRAWVVRLKRDDASAWQDFLRRLDSSSDLTWALRSILAKLGFLIETLETGRVELSLPPDVKPFSRVDEREFLKLLELVGQDEAVFPNPLAHHFPDQPVLYTTEDANKFIPPSKEAKGEIMYIEMKPGLAGPARIGRVQFSKTRKTIYYEGRKLQSLKGLGYKANYYDVESAMWYWVSRCKKDGSDTLYPGIVEIDDDVREEYWTQIRQQPENKHLTRFRSPGKYSKRRPS